MLKKLVVALSMLTLSVGGPLVLKVPVLMAVVLIALMRVLL